MDELFYQIALTLTPGIGPVKARTMLAHCGTAGEIFRRTKNQLQEIPEIGPTAATEICKKASFKQAESEARFVEVSGIKPLFITSSGYPDRLRQCDDAPILLFTRGKLDLNANKVISVVGTRTATSYGKHFCEQLMKAVSPFTPLVVSGLAYGIDICAHRAALAVGLPTAACLAHGLDRIYPGLHTSVAREMERSGGLVSEFPSGTRPDRELFPMRNRIIAGLADCTIVVETDRSGGSMITAHLANGYGREVFALPGRISDPHSAGCNLLIRKNIAAILASPEDLPDYMNWMGSPGKSSMQLNLFADLNPAESLIVRTIEREKRVAADTISHETSTPPHVLSAILIDLEFRGIVKCLPGKIYALTE